MKCKLLITYYAGKARYLSINGTEIFNKVDADKIIESYTTEMAQFNHLIKEIVIEKIPSRATTKMYQQHQETLFLR